MLSMASRVSLVITCNKYSFYIQILYYIMLTPLKCNSANNNDDAEKGNNTFCGKYINNNNKFMEQFRARRMFVLMVEY